MKDIYDKITAHILGALDDAGQWKPCWHGMNASQPTNMTSGHRYRGVNILTCWVTQMIHGYPTQQWASYKQWQTAGAQVRRGETGTPIIFYNKTTSEDPDDNGRIFVRSSYVYNLAQVDGAEGLLEPHEKLDDSQRIALLDEWCTAVGLDAHIEHSDEGRAYYRPGTDSVMMPDFGSFHTPEHYYAVLFHELVHWTGAKHRLDREFRRTREDYAKEELVAELGAAFLAGEYGIGHVTRDDHVNYLAAWLKALKDDKRLIVRAASQASAAADYLNGIAATRSEQIREAA